MSTRQARPLGQGGLERRLVDEVVAQDLDSEGVEQLLVGVPKCGASLRASACSASAETPASMALVSCAFQEYWASNRGGDQQHSSRSR